MDRIRVVVWGLVFQLALGVAVGPELLAGEPTVYAVKDQHEDCGSPEDSVVAAIEQERRLRPFST